MTETPPSGIRPSGGHHRARSIGVLVVFGPPFMLLATGLVGAAYAYAVSAGIRVHLSGEPEGSAFVE